MPVGVQCNFCDFTSRCTSASQARGVFDPEQRLALVSIAKSLSAGVSVQAAAVPVQPYQSLPHCGATTAIGLGIAGLLLQKFTAQSAVTLKYQYVADRTSARPAAPAVAPIRCMRWCQQPCRAVCTAPGCQRQGLPLESPVLEQGCGDTAPWLALVSGQPWCQGVISRPLHNTASACCMRALSLCRSSVTSRGRQHSRPLPGISGRTATAGHSYNLGFEPVSSRGVILCC
jgi:hypothetical protein